MNDKMSINPSRTNMFILMASIWLPTLAAFLPRHQSSWHGGSVSTCVRPANVLSTKTNPATQPHHNSRLSRLFASEEIDVITMDAEERMEKSVDSVRLNLVTIRTGRANPSMLDRVKVDYYGVETPLNQMATIAVPSAQQLSVTPYDKSSLSAIERAITESDLGMTPNSDGTMIRLNIPQLTEDRRKELLKQCKAMGEEGKVAVRNIRRDGVEAIKKLEKNGDIGKDEMADGTDAMQKLTDKVIKTIDDIVAAKEKEVMTV